MGRVDVIILIHSADNVMIYEKRKNMKDNECANCPHYDHGYCNRYAIEASAIPSCILKPRK